MAELTLRWDVNVRTVSQGRPFIGNLAQKFSRIFASWRSYGLNLTPETYLDLASLQARSLDWWLKIMGA